MTFFSSNSILGASSSISVLRGKTGQPSGPADSYIGTEFGSPLFWYDYDGVNGGTNPDGLTSGQADLSFTIPRTYTTSKNGDDRLALQYHEFEWSTTSGAPYENSYSTLSNANPANPRHKVVGVTSGSTLYYRYRTIDHAGVAGGWGSEKSAIAYTPETSEPTPDALITNAGLPFTISTSGVYKIDEALAWDGAGNAININSDGVLLLGRDEDLHTYSQTVGGCLVSINGNRDNVEIYGVKAMHGGYAPTSNTSVDVCAILLSNSSSCTKINIHNNVISHGVPNVNSRITSSYGAIVGESSEWTGEIHNNDITLYGVNSSANRGISGSTQTAGYMGIYDNVITYRDVSGSVNGYVRAINGGSEIYNNTLNSQDITMSQLGTVGILPDNDAFIHGNVFNSLRTNSARYILLEENRADCYVLYNTFNVTDGFRDSAGPNRGIRIRFGASGHVIGYNTFNALGTTTTTDPRSVLCIIYGDEYPNWTLPPRDCVLHNNVSNGAGRGIVDCQEIATNVNTFGNTAAGGDYGMYLRASSVGQRMTNMWSVNDDIQGDSSDVLLQSSNSVIPVRAIDTITRSGSVATVTIQSSGGTTTGLVDGILVTITGADQPEYNVVDAPCTVIDDITFTVPVAGTPVTPATGASISTTYDISGAAVSNVNFITPITPLAISAISTPTSVQNVDYFLDGDSGLTNMSFDNYDLSRVPSAPTV